MIIIDLEGTGRNIKRLREELGLSVKNLAAYFPYQTPQAIYNWQQGKNLPAPENMLVLSRVFHKPMEDIYCFHEFPQEADEPKGSSVFKFFFNDGDIEPLYTEKRGGLTWVYLSIL